MAHKQWSEVASSSRYRVWVNKAKERKKWEGEEERRSPVGKCCELDETNGALWWDWLPIRLRLWYASVDIQSHLGQPLSSDSICWLNYSSKYLFWLICWKYSHLSRVENIDLDKALSSSCWYDLTFISYSHQPPTQLLKVFENVTSLITLPSLISSTPES